MPLRYSDVLSVAPTTEPVNLHEAKAACDIDGNYRDTEVSRWIVEARRMVEYDARTALINQSRILTLHGFPPSICIELPAVHPLSSVTSIYYDDVSGSDTLLATSVYKVDTYRHPGAIWLKKNQVWPNTYAEANAVRITYVAGYGSAASDVPETAKQAILMLVRHRHENPGLTLDSGVNPEGYDALINRLSMHNYP